MEKLQTQTSAHPVKLGRELFSRFVIDNPKIPVGFCEDCNLEKEGVYPAFGRKLCTVCIDAGYARLSSGGSVAEENSRFAALQAEAGIPELFRRCRLQELDVCYGAPDFATKQAREAALWNARAMTISNYSGLGISLHGDTGVGKTHLAAAIANEFLAQGQSVKWIDGLDLQRQIRRDWHHDERRDPFYSGIENEIAAHRLVVIEDLTPQEKLPDFVASSIVAILNAIYNRGSENCLLCLTSNLSLPNLAKIVMPSMQELNRNGFYSRMKAITNGFVLSGQDLRELQKNGR